MRRLRLPSRRRQRAAVGAQPCEFLHVAQSIGRGVQVAIASQHGEVVPQLRKRSCELKHAAVLFLQRPIDPTDLVVLAVGVVVAVLRSGKLVARKHHGRALRQ